MKRQVVLFEWLPGGYVRLRTVSNFCWTTSSAGVSLGNCLDSTGYPLLNQQFTLKDGLGGR